MKIEIPQIKRCKLEQSDDDDKIGISVISTFKFVSTLSVFGFFSFEIIYLCNLVLTGIMFSNWQTLDTYSSCIMSLRGNVKLYYIIE